MEEDIATVVIQKLGPSMFTVPFINKELPQVKPIPPTSSIGFLKTFEHEPDTFWLLFSITFSTR